jgi:hypothetical protein
MFHITIHQLADGSRGYNMDDAPKTASPEADQQTAPEQREAPATEGAASPRQDWLSNSFRSARRALRI